ncbi:hypothetical protein MUS1_02030 [Marinomonas ushuaiensis DSM 15871]|uniref:Uncharacterized protein n=1 Tax=Marinomonas ushuaiensis DSM 15871 TaxID=1122207 RepID=X7E9A4_9GAMM|nr:hypothetical protein MUS1_02030 [Marinomonas ushuaiensis DSM 15871]
MLKIRMMELKKWCAYSHIANLISMLIHGKSLSGQTRVGRNIALLGLFCPFFWIALFSGVRGTTLMFHAAHSSLVFLIGAVIMIISLIKQERH